ncbi:FMN-binding glutamate synthase family protein [Halobacillus salinarum]|uniref:FMN-binding glutamate synthase family protein n=1 Tax=Halobacillus salinarum TaxID=2932257 RepID=A0ABY4EMS1_9BACI|nr:FMN-binding glutamate synthase family protein [Halobacillus salinarum]UOQ45282.1 FMN-binding glutamate synthase family protein [Halobacillus salinarum]
MVQTTLMTLVTLLLILVIVVPLILVLRLYFHDKQQREHSVLRNFPVLGKARYILEKMGPELRQYLFNNDNEGKPFTRREFVFVNVAGKYNSRMIGYGSERDFEKDGYYVSNSMFPTHREELKILQEPKVKTKLYQVDEDKLFARKEHREDAEIDPYLLTEENRITLGKDTVRHPFTVSGLIGQSAMSFGSLGDHAITALSKGLGMAGGTWMNTGEGSLSPYHLKGGVDVIMQIGPGLFGVRTKDGEFSWEEFKQKSEIEQVKAFELKLGQGAKTRGGHVDGKKVTEEIAEIRDVEPYQDIDSPNRFRQFDSVKEMLTFIQELREVGGKPVGIKIVVGNEEEVENMIRVMSEEQLVPDFITVDGGNGGTGASYFELASGVGLPTFAALPLVHDLLCKYDLRERTHIIASGQLITPDKIAMALALGADMVNIARGFMMTVGCIMAEVCHTNNCPVGVATTDPDLQKALDIEEKKYRTCNYVVSLREGLFNMAAAAGIDSPTKFERKHIRYKEALSKVLTFEEHNKKAVH